nr:hypothetical protein BaRGS_007180 [Batillaria attramentaria]
MTLAESKQTYIEMVYQWVISNNSTGNMDYTQPYVRRSLRYVYPLFMFLYTLVGVLGIVGNAAMLVVLARRRLYHDQTFFLMGNLALSDLLKCVLVLPITLANLLINNWLFGSFLCFFLPMMQSFPIHASILTFLMIAIDRYRLILHPFKSRLPAGLCVIAVWVTAVCTVLPFAIYIKYIDLGATLGEEFEGVGICYVAIEERIEEYIRALFVTLYVMPLAVIAFLFVRISAEIKSRETSTISIHFATQNTHSGTTAATAARELIDHACKASSTWSTAHVTSGAPASRGVEVPPPASIGDDLHHLSGHHHHHHHHHHGHRNSHGSGGGGGSGGVGGERGSRDSGSGGGVSGSGSGLRGVSNPGAGGSPGSGSRDSAVRIKSFATAATERSTQDSDDDLDPGKEKRTQNYLITMTTVFAMCWCPLNILILVNYFVHENDTNEESYDITYITFTWFGFLSTCTNPVLFASWRMSNATKDRLRGYFRFSNRRHNTAQFYQRH